MERKIEERRFRLLKMRYGLCGSKVYSVKELAEKEGVSRIRIYQITNSAQWQLINYRYKNHPLRKEIEKRLWDKGLGYPKRATRLFEKDMLK